MVGSETLLVSLHKLVDKLQLLTGHSLDVVGADREGDLLNHSKAHLIHPRSPRHWRWHSRSRRSSSRRFDIGSRVAVLLTVELTHKIHGAQQVSRLGNHVLHRSTKLGLVLGINVTVFDLEVGRPDIPHVSEVRAGVVVKERVLWALV